MKITVDQFNIQFEYFQDHLKSYLYRLTCNREDTEDLVHETYIKAQSKLELFNGKSSLKTWVFSIATNLAKDNKRVQNRWAIDVQDDCKNASMRNSELQTRIFDAFNSQVSKTFDIREHMNYCFTCIAKNLSLKKQIAIILKEIYQFKRIEIAHILGITEGVTKHLLFDGRNEIQTKYDQRCAMINKTGICYQCAELNDTLQRTANAETKIKSFGFEEGDSINNLDRRFEHINKINPFNGNGAILEDTIMQILRETIKDN